MQFSSRKVLAVPLLFRTRRGPLREDRDLYYCGPAARRNNKAIEKPQAME